MKCKVCKVKVCKVGDKDKLILQNLFQNREGLRVKTLIKLTIIKQRTLYKRLNLLKKKGLIENIFPMWKLVNGQVKYVQTLLNNNNIFELHNMRSEEHTSELQSHSFISYAVFCLKKKKK